MTLNSKKKKNKINSSHMIRITAQAWYALQRAKITAIERGAPKTPSEIASGIILDRLGVA